jgi:hypothetical protein
VIDQALNLWVGEDVETHASGTLMVLGVGMSTRRAFASTLCADGHHPHHAGVALALSEGRVAQVPFCAIVGTHAA